MGEIADEMIGRMLEFEGDIRQDIFGDTPYPRSEPVWRTKSGEDIRLRDMEMTHLDNSIRLLERKRVECMLTHEPAPDAVNQWLPLLKNERAQRKKRLLASLLETKEEYDGL